MATTSAGHAWDLGTADGDRLDRDRALGAVARVAAAVRVPVSADIESGYAKDAAGVGDTIRAVLAAGAVGVNIEDALYGGEGTGDGGRGPLRPVAEQAERIAAARAAADAAGVPLFINAHRHRSRGARGASRRPWSEPPPSSPPEPTGSSFPGPSTRGRAKSLVAGVEGPLNVLVGPGAPSVAELAALGVARISMGRASRRPRTPWSAVPRGSC